MTHYYINGLHDLVKIRHTSKFHKSQDRISICYKSRYFKNYMVENIKSMPYKL